VTEVPATFESKLLPHNPNIPASIKDGLSHQTPRTHTANMATKVPLLDEQDYNNPPLLYDLPDQDINLHNNFCWYFHTSQFYEPACNNSAILAFHKEDPASQHGLHDRKIFDERLRGIPEGTQFVVAGEPQGEGQPWLYQRQNKVRDQEGKVNTFVEGNWYNRGTQIIMAPSVLDVVQARLLAISTRLQQVSDLSQNMTHWSPATGHSYFPSSLDAPKAAATTSRIGSPTLAPTDLEQADGATAQPTDPAESTTDFSDALFLESLRLTNRFGDEYMDENPLKGEPGAFVFTNTKNAVDERNKAQEQMAQAASSQVPAPRLETQPPSVAPSVAATPKGASTPAAIEGHSRKSSTATVSKDKKRERRKSKGLASPTTPGVPPLG
jgi:mediator of RNA polymerase II transcription subunit 6